MDVSVAELPGFDPRSHLEYEERLFNELRRTPVPACLFYICEPCIVLGRSNQALEWLHAAAAAEDGIPVLRRFSGGGTVYLDHDVLNYSLIMPRDLLEQASAGTDSATDAQPQPTTLRYIAWFRRLIIQALSRGGAGFTATGTSDISLNGRKISGNAQRIAANLVLHHGTLMLRCPLAAITRYLPIPPNRPGVGHGEFVTGLLEEGNTSGRGQLQDWIADEFQKTINAIHRC